MQIIRLIVNFCRMIGVAIFLWGVWMLVQVIFQRITCKSYTTATVVDIHKRRYTDEDGEYIISRPIFSYNVSGTTYTKESDSGSSKAEYTIGQEIEIYYNSSKPDKCYIKGDKNEIIAGLLLVIMGLMVVSIR